ncbi:hypothetical protein CHLRE_06g278700v5 [Chlamydomonas reinhardtii]|uniref:Uncharacterized protein n=1 Tax=Chlamydomonas reinhardtii TaxID=3055 RepID=A0A2K3DPG6_CHLRE|nr:uncharacterized protein CHLRE_06g278700v5 [Chlamydomonas reinhardtii]PNW82433.1 hypothetical protein CHLRE_06g278700v5 [Chlamydomonas reinhardtii]
MPPKEADDKAPAVKPAAPRAAASPSRARPGAAAPKPATGAAKPAVTTTGAAAKPTLKPASSSAPSTATAMKSSGATKPAAGASKVPSASSTSSVSKGSTAKPVAKGSTAAPTAKKAGTPAPAAKKKAAAVDAAASATTEAASPPTVPAEDSPEVLARKAEQELKLAEELEALRKAAWAAQLEFERKQEAKRHAAREEEARRKKEEAALRKKLLEAAYDGEDEEVRKGIARAKEAGMLKPDPVDTADGHGNTLLSEAAAGGVESTVAMLLEMGADPNSRGEFKRTPLWRAAFLGKAEVVPLLLEGGADPRIGNEGGELPDHVAAEPIKGVLKDWDVAKTDALLQKFEAIRLERAAAASAERAYAVKGAEASVTACEEAHNKAQLALKHARMELEKRIFEYDTCVEEKKPDSLTQAALDQVHVAEKVVDEARARAAEASHALDESRLRLREEVEQVAADEGGADAALPGIPVPIKALNDVLIRDVGGKLAASSKWPLVVDTSGQASVFLRYQDTNYVNALNARHMEPHTLRRSLLGAIRYGKAMVLDLQDCDLWPEMPRMFDQVQQGLLGKVLDRSLLKNEAFASLIRAEDGEEYDINKFQDIRIRSFVFIVLTSARRPNKDLVEAMYTLRVMVAV